MEEGGGRSGPHLAFSAFRRWREVKQVWMTGGSRVPQPPPWLSTLSPSARPHRLALHFWAPGRNWLIDWLVLGG